VVAQVQSAPSGLEVETDIQPALQDTQKAVHSRPGPATIIISHIQDLQEDLDAGGNFQDICLEPLRTFDAVIGEIADVWAILLIRTELIWFYRYIPMQRWHWACCLVQPKYVFIFFLPISYC
jgi:hypothetical protein